MSVDGLAAAQLKLHIRIRIRINNSRPKFKIGQGRDWEKQMLSHLLIFAGKWPNFSDARYGVKCGLCRLQAQRKHTQQSL
jgi:hypothetical protein